MKEIKKSGKTEQSKAAKWLNSALTVVLSWAACFLVALCIIVVTGATRIHQIAILASMAYVLIGFILFVIRYILGNIYNEERVERKGSSLTPFRTFLILASMAMFLMFVPIYDTLEGKDFWRTLCLSIHNTMRLFVVDGDFQIVHDYLDSSYAVHGAWANVFMSYSVFMFILAPIMSAGFVLSFVKDAWAQILSNIRLGKNIYYMSELNTRSIALAKNIKKAEKKAIVVFFDVYHQHGEEHQELLERAIRYGTICFRKDISSVGFVRPRKTRKFFLIGENEEENLKQAIDLVKRCDDTLRKSENAELYIFATTADSEFLVDELAKKVRNKGDRIKVRRIDVTKNLALRTVEDTSAIFPRAREAEKKVNIVIVGAGSFGTELLKTYCWASQLPNCNPTIHILDKDEKLNERLELEMPELMECGKKAEKDSESETEFKRSDARYTISVYENIDVTHSDFEKKIKEIHKDGIDIVFVCLGDDELNVRVAMDVRRIIGRQLDENTDLPIIKSVVFSSRKTEILSKNDDKDIEYIGSMREVYSLDNIESTDKEKDAIRYHMYWAACDLKETFDKLKPILESGDEEPKQDPEENIKKTQQRLLSLLEEEKPLEEGVEKEVKNFVEKLSLLIGEFAKITINNDNKNKFDISSMEFSAYEKELFEQVEFIEKDRERILELVAPCKRIQRNKAERLLKKAVKIANENPILALIYYKGKVIDSRTRYNIEEYCRRSSVARAVYAGILEKLSYCFKETPDKVLLSGEEKQRLEHARWNAFMRAEGYVFTENQSLKSAKTKMHNLLNKFEELGEYDKEKDKYYDFMDGEAK